MRCKNKATLMNGYDIDLRCDREEGHKGMHWHDNHVEIREGGECNIEVTWGEDE